MESRRMIGVGHWEASDRERELVNQVLDSGRLSYGPVSKEFESRFAEIHGSRFGVLSNSGTSSLQVALQAMKEEHGWQPYHEVIVPAVTFVASLNVVLHNNMTPVLVDVDRRTYNMDMSLLQFNENTRCVIPVNLFGQQADMKELVQRVAWENVNRSHDNKIRVLVDSCETMFATHHGKPIGYWGDIQCFSTYMAHLITTGVGGVATTNNLVYATRLRSLVNHGRDSIYISMDDRENIEILDRRFRFVSVGHSFRITELEAALGLAQLETWPDMIAMRQENAEALSHGFRVRGLDALQLPCTLPENSHSWMMYPIVLKSGSKWDLCNYLEERGVETREMLPLTNQPVYNIDQDRYPVAKWVNENGFYIASHQGLTKEDLDHIIDTFRNYYAR